MELLDRLIKYIDTPYPLCQDIHEAKQYLNFLIKENIYDNSCPVDIIDYEKLLYIDVHYGTNPIIKQLLDVVKNNIALNYEYKYKFLSRIMDDTYINYLHANQLNNSLELGHRFDGKEDGRIL